MYLVLNMTSCKSSTAKFAMSCYRNECYKCYDIQGPARSCGCFAMLLQLGMAGKDLSAEPCTVVGAPAPSPAVGLDLDGCGGRRVVEERPLVRVPLVVLVVGPAHRQVQLTAAAVRRAAIVHVVPAVAVVSTVMVASVLQETCQMSDTSQVKGVICSTY